MRNLFVWSIADDPKSLIGGSGQPLPDIAGRQQKALHSIVKFIPYEPVQFATGLQSSAPIAWDSRRQSSPISSPRRWDYETARSHSFPLSPVPPKPGHPYVPVLTDAVVV